jgi:hypothetical protein
MEGAIGSLGLSCGLGPLDVTLYPIQMLAYAAKVCPCDTVHSRRTAVVNLFYKAYRLSLGGKPAPVIDGLNGDQRFYMGFAQTWRGKIRENELIMCIKADPHSLDQYRGTVTEMNQTGFYTAFDVKGGDKMYLPPDRRVTIW